MTRRTVATLVAGVLAATLVTSCSGGSAPDRSGRSSAPSLSVPTPTPPTTSSTATTLGPRFTDAAPCQTSFTCATFTVPLDRAHSAAFSVPLQVAVETEATAPRGVLVFLTGGPGAAEVPTATDIADWFGPEVLAAYRLVLVDPRGTGPTALQCSALQTASTDDLTPPAAAVVDCAQTLGPARGFYATDDTVADLDALRAALGAPRLTLSAVSYGTFVAQQYALAHPTRTAALVLDSVVPYDLDDPLQVQIMQATRRVLRSACRAADCPGDPVADLASVVRHDHLGVVLLEVLRTMSGADPTYADLLPALHDAARGDRSRLDSLLDDYRAGQVADPAVFSTATHASAACADQVYPWGRSDAVLASRPAAVRRATDVLAATAFAPFDEGTARGLSAIKECGPWPPVAPARLRSPGRLPAVPTLLLAGGRDLATPLEYTQQTADRAPRGRLVVVPTAGHIVAGTEGKGRDAERAFLLR